MSEELITAICPNCGAKNRVPANRWREHLRCGRCKQPLDLQNLYPERTVSVTDATFQREVVDIKGPVMAEFYSPS